MKMDNENLTQNTTLILSVDYIDYHNEEILMESWCYYLAAIILLLIGIFGFSLNLFVVILMCKDVQLWTPMNIILFNLVCSDFSVSIFGNPFTLIAALSKGWIFGKKMCEAYGFFMALLGITSITTLTVLAYERYSVITFPLSSKPITKQSAVISIGLIWSYSLTLTAPPLFGWGSYVNEAANISCSVNWESKSYNATSYIVFLFIFGLVVPVIIISYSYIKILLTMKQSSYRLGRKNPGEKRITCMIAIMILAFLIAWTPYATFALIEQFGPKNLISSSLAVLPALFAKSSICYNPLIYVGLNTQFRTAWKNRVNKKESTVDTSTHQITQQRDSDNPMEADNSKCTPKLLKQSKEIFTKTKFTKFISNNKKSLNDKNLNEFFRDNDNVDDDMDNDTGDGENKNNGISLKIINNIKNQNENDDNLIENQTDSEIKHELTVFNDGKLMLIKKNSYYSNII